MCLQSKEKLQIIEVNMIMKLVIALFFSIFRALYPASKTKGN